MVKMVQRPGNNISQKIYCIRDADLQKVNHIMDQVKKTNPVSLEDNFWIFFHNQKQFYLIL